MKSVSQLTAAKLESATGAAVLEVEAVTVLAGLVLVTVPEAWIMTTPEPSVAVGFRPCTPVDYAKCTVSNCTKTVTITLPLRKRRFTGFQPVVAKYPAGDVEMFKAFESPLWAW